MTYYAMYVMLQRYATVYGTLAYALLQYAILYMLLYMLLGMLWFIILCHTCYAAVCLFVSTVCVLYSPGDEQPCKYVCTL